MAIELMPLQREIVRLAAQGNSNKEIGLELDMTDLMVKNRLFTIQRRLKSRNRAHLVATAIRLGLVPADIVDEKGGEDARERVC